MLLVLQKRALRLIYFAQAREHAILLFLKGNLLSLEFLCYEKGFHLMYDINNNSALINILNLFSKITSGHSYSTRSSTSENSSILTNNPYLTFKIRPFRVLASKSGMGYQLVSKSYPKTQKIITSKLIEILETENSYAEIDTMHD